MGHSHNHGSTSYGKAFAIGVGGTLAYCRIAVLVMSLHVGNREAHPVRYQLFEFLGSALVIPLIPGSLPGVLTAYVLDSLRITKLLDMDDGDPIMVALVSTSLVNSYVVYWWLRRRSYYQSSNNDSPTGT